MRCSEHLLRDLLSNTDYTLDDVLDNTINVVTSQADCSAVVRKQRSSPLDLQHATGSMFRTEASMNTPRWAATADKHKELTCDMLGSPMILVANRPTHPPTQKSRPSGPSKSQVCVHALPKNIDQGGSLEMATRRAITGNSGRLHCARSAP